jgi:hypothetical protein
MYLDKAHVQHYEIKLILEWNLRASSSLSSLASVLTCSLMKRTLNIFRSFIYSECLSARHNNLASKINPSHHTWTCLYYQLSHSVSQLISNNNLSIWLAQFQAHIGTINRGNEWWILLGSFQSNLWIDHKYKPSYCIIATLLKVANSLNICSKKMNMQKKLCDKDQISP